MIFWILGTALFLFAVLLLLPALVFYDVALNPKGRRPNTSSPEMTEMLEGYARFFDRAQREEWHIRSFDGLTLCGYLIQQENPRGVVILCHGYTMQARGIAGPASWFFEHGYSVLLPDARGHGKSEGRFFGMGWPERRDMLGWIARVNDAMHTPPIILYGISMGGATVMMTTGEAALPKNVLAAVEDCGYTSVWDEFAYQLRHLFHLPAFPLLYLVDRLARLRTGFGFRDASALRQVKKSRTPTLFIHGDADTFVPYAFMQQVYNAAGCEKEMLTVPGAPHGLAAPTNPELYWSNVERFLDKYVPKPV